MTMLFDTSNALGFPVLSLTVFLPLAGALLLAILPRRHDALYHAVGLMVAGTTLVLAAVLFWQFDRGWSDPLQRGAAFQFADPPHVAATWLPGGITYQVAVDGISVTLVLLTALLTFVALLFSWVHVHHRVREYVAAALVLETGMLGVFTALDLFLFYVFWEAALIPMALLIALWGGKQKLYATFKFLLYTMAGSALMLVAIVAVVVITGSPTFHLLDVLRQDHLPPATQMLLFAAFALAFAVKVPLFPFHTWLPDAHVEAPTAGSVLLAGVLLKLGTYGFVRFALPLFPAAAADAAPILIALGVIGVWYGAWVAYAQTDIKSLVAYSSVSHMGIVVLGIFALNAQGFAGGTLQMINHGLSTGALFLLVGMLYERAHSRRIADFGGLWARMPRFSALFLIVTFSSIGLPGTNGFVGEWLALLGTFRANVAAGVLATFGVVLGAAYMLWLFQRVFFGPPAGKSLEVRDLTPLEVAALAPLVVLIFWIGLYPDTFLQPIDQAGQAWLDLVRANAAVVGAPPAP